MQFQRSKFTTAALVGTLLILAARVAWHASHAEVGWELIQHDWGRNLVGFAGFERPALCDQEPEDQARFWLQEVETLNATTWSPRVAAGAAWILDSPGTKFLRHHFRENKATQGFPGLPLGAHVELDSAAVERVVAQFEDLCHERCMTLIENATNADASNVELWRARALLLFRNELLGLGFEPRDPDWQSVLNECARHDSDNALYDYLAALTEWKRAANHREENAGFVVEVRDPEALKRGNERFAEGLEKTQLMFGSDAYADTATFLENSSISRLDRLETAESRAIGSRPSRLLYSLLRWQLSQQSAQRRNGDFAAAAATMRATLRIAEQVTATGNPTGLLVEPLMLRRSALANLADLSVAAPDLFAAGELANIDADRREIRIHLEVISKAGERLRAKDHPQQGRGGAVAQALAVMTKQFAAAILLIGFCFTILARVCGKAGPVESLCVGASTHLIALFAGLALSFVVLGMCPAGIISASIQTGVVRGLVAVPFVIALIGSLILLNRIFRVGYWQLTALSVSFAMLWAVIFYWVDFLGPVIDLVGQLDIWAILLTAVAIPYAGWFTLRMDLAFVRRTDLSGHRKAWLTFFLQLLAAFTVPWWRTVADFVATKLETRIWVPSRAWSEAQLFGVTPDELQGVMQLDRRPWLWALVQWDAYHGFYAGLGFSLLLLVVWLTFRLNRTTTGGGRLILRQDNISFVRLIAATASRSLIIAGTGAFLVYMATFPAVIDERDAYYRRHYSQVTDPVHYRKELDAEIAAVRNDPKLMDEILRKAEN